MEFIENLFNSSTFYYVLIGIAYVLCIIFVIMLLVKRKKKRYTETKPEIKKDLDSVDLEAVLGKMQEEASKPKDEIMTFEEEQEEKAIISYQELLNAVKKNVQEVTNQPEVKKDETLESIIEELEENKEETVEEIKQDSVLEPIVLQSESNIQTVEKEQIKPSKFQNSEFISPIFGRINNEIEYPKIKSFEEPKEEKDLEKTIVMPKTDIDSNDEFLRVLKEFRNNLE